MVKLLSLLVLSSLLVGVPSLRAQQASPLATTATVAAGPAASLRPGDLLRLRIWREPDLSGDFPVDETGAVTLPRLGAVRLDTIPADSLRPRLVQAYQTYLNNPTIEVTPLRRVAVIGAVLKPGLYPVDATMTVADVLALAGGASPNGKTNKVELRREGKRLAGDIDLGSSVAATSLRSGDQLYVPQRSWLARNTWAISAAVGALTTVTVAAVR